MALALAGCGDNVAILDLNLPAADVATRRIHELGGKALAIGANMVEKVGLDLVKGQNTCT